LNLAFDTGDDTGAAVCTVHEGSEAVVEDVVRGGGGGGGGTILRCELAEGTLL
jgi:hypothetical protein